MQKQNQSKTVVIDEIYLKQAFEIRKDFENIILLTNTKQKEISKLKESIHKLKTELIENKKAIKEGEIQVMDNIYKILDSLDFETKKLSKIINPIEEKQKELKKSEDVLYSSLKEKYPHYSDEDLKNRIIEYIIEKRS